MDVFVEKWSKNCKKIRYVVDRKQDKFLDGILPFSPRRALPIRAWRLLSNLALELRFAKHCSFIARLVRCYEHS